MLFCSQLWIAVIVAGLAIAVTTISVIATHLEASDRTDRKVAASAAAILPFSASADLGVIITAKAKVRMTVAVMTFNLVLSIFNIEERGC